MPDGFDGYGWEGYLNRARRDLDWTTLEKEEIDYKKDTERLLRDVRDDVLAGRDVWLKHIKAHPLSKYLANLCGPMPWIKLVGWFNASPEDSCKALGTLWREDEPWSGRRLARRQVIGRIRDFSSQLHQSGVISGGGVGTRLRVTAALLLAVDADRYPPFMRTLFDEAYDHTGYTVPPKDADEGALYDHALTFLDQLVKRASAQQLGWPRNRLEAQSVVWCMRSDALDGGESC